MNNNYITSISKFLDKINKIQNETEQNLEIFYRGVNSKIHVHENSPKIYRGYINSEAEIIENTLVNKFYYFKNCKTAIEKLEIMQHYGLPTRLLDITRNPLVALFFACQNLKSNGMVVIYKIKREYVKYNDSDIVSILANIAFMEKEFELKFQKDSQEKLDIENIYYQKLVAQIKKEKPYFVSKIEKKHINNYVVCVIPNYNNRRIIAQQGAFLLYGINGKKSNCAEISKKQDKYIQYEELQISYQDKEKILNELENIGITKAVLFPELDNYIDYIDRKFKNK